MCRKSFALSLLLCLPLCFLSAQDTASGDSQILENQNQILLILPGLIESSLLREADLSKKEQISNDREADLTLKESELQKKEQSISERETELSQSDKDMQTLKDSVKTQSELLKKEQDAGVWKNKAIVVLSAALIGSVVYLIVK